jgi:hypothetical protein
MKNALEVVTDWIAKLSDLLLSLVILGIIIGVLFDDPFGVIAGIGKLMTQFGENGLAGLLALILIVVLYQKK